jgi:hypothetical protein
MDHTKVVQKIRQEMIANVLFFCLISPLFDKYKKGGALLASPTFGTINAITSAEGVRIFCLKAVPSPFQDLLEIALTLRIRLIG